jgi:uncharacterized protein
MMTVGGLFYPSIYSRREHTEAVGLHGDALKIKLAASRVEGAANTVLQKFLAEIFCVPLRQVRLTQGVQSRRKVVEIWQTAYSPRSIVQSGRPGSGLAVYTIQRVCWHLRDFTLVWRLEQIKICHAPSDPFQQTLRRHLPIHA